MKMIIYPQVLISQWMIVFYLPGKMENQKMVTNQSNLMQKLRKDFIHQGLIKLNHLEAHLKVQIVKYYRKSIKLMILKVKWTIMKVKMYHWCRKLKAIFSSLTFIEEKFITWILWISYKKKNQEIKWYGALY